MNAWMFFGQDGWRGYSLDESGYNLPADKGPWSSFKNISIGPDDAPHKELSSGQAYVMKSEDSSRA